MLPYLQVSSVKDAVLTEQASTPGHPAKLRPRPGAAEAEEHLPWPVVTAGLPATCFLQGKREVQQRPVPSLSSLGWLESAAFLLPSSHMKHLLCPPLTVINAGSGILENGVTLAKLTKHIHTFHQFISTYVSFINAEHPNKDSSKSTCLLIFTTLPCITEDMPTISLEKYTNSLYLFVGDILFFFSSWNTVFLWYLVILILKSESNHL